MRSFEFLDSFIVCHKGGGGGSGAGKVQYPVYMEDFHERLLTQGLDRDTNAKTIENTLYDLWDNSPYADPNLAAYNPTQEITNIQSELSLFSAFVSSIDPTALLSSYAEAAKSFAFSMVDTTVFNDMMDVMEKTNAAELATAKARFAGNMADINAVNSSAFVIGLALMEEGNLRELTRANMAFTLQHYKDVLILVGDAISKLAGWFQLKAELMTKQLIATGDVNKLSVLLSNDYLEVSRELEVKAAIWNLEIAQLGSNSLGGISGASHSGPGGLVGGKPKVDAGAAGASGAFSGAISGAMIGTSIYPGIGTAVGAVVGAAAGYGAGYYGAQAQNG